MSSRGPMQTTPQLAMRVAAFAIIAFGIFAVLFLRLWFLQVLQADQYSAQARSNRVRVVRIAAPRGSIVDRNKQMLVGNRLQTVVSLRSDAVPAADRATIANWGQKQGTYDVALQRATDALVARGEAADAARARSRTPAQRRRLARSRRDETPARARARKAAETRRGRRRLARAERGALARIRRQGPADPRTLTAARDASPQLAARLRQVGPLLHVSEARLYRRVVQSLVKLPYADVPLKTSHVSDAVRNYVLEQQRRFPDLVATTEYQRTYFRPGLASQLFGNISQISADQLKEAKYRGLRAGQRIGQDGLEYEYNAFLQGRDGAQSVEVDSQGLPTGVKSTADPVQGKQLQISLDTRLEQAGQTAIDETIRHGVDSKTGYRAGGSYVALDPRNGEILAMGSYPTVNLNRIYGASIGTRSYNRAVGKKAGVPLLNRAIQGTYPTGSTFKIVTALAGLSTGVITPQTEDGGGACIEVGRLSQTFCNAGSEDLGSSNLERALQVSSDVYFYRVGEQLFSKPGQPLQTWARSFGYGARTGVDLPGEQAGTIPDAAWRRKRNAEEIACTKQKGSPCGLVGDVNGQFLQGDEINLSTGQGDFLATPLQVATAYAGLYDPPGRGTPDLHFPTPHLGMQVQTADGQLDRTFPAAARRTVKVPGAGWKADILKGLHEVTSTPDGTAGKVFAGWDQSTFPVFGKTGTAQRCADSSCPDQAWFAAMVPDPTNPIVVVATVENGEFGATTAGPIVCRMLRTWYHQSARTAPCSATQGGLNTTE